MALVNFRYGTAAEFAALENKDPNTIYFIADERKIYKGDVSYSSGVYLAVDAFPQSPETGVLYVNQVTGEVRFYNGLSWVTVVKASPATFSSNPDNNTLATQKAVVDYLADKLNDLDVGQLANKITVIESSITTLQTGKADKATDLAGYGISNAYTKDEVDLAISTAVGNADHLKREIVDVLPPFANADPNTIYMLSVATGTPRELYEEYMFINGDYEKIGDSTVDLTNYATKEELANAYETVEENINTISQTKADAAYANAVSYVNDLSKNFATAAQGEKADTALQKADIVTGTVNGTIRVDGNNVPVYGLGSAAYTEASTYELAGAGTSALNQAKDYTDQQIEQALVWREILA